jgi:protein-S-isoprenylcysteine O-methyltransferase Ste14
MKWKVWIGFIWRRIGTNRVTAAPACSVLVVVVVVIFKIRIEERHLLKF